MEHASSSLPHTLLGCSHGLRRNLVVGRTFSLEDLNPSGCVLLPWLGMLEQANLQGKDCQYIQEYHAAR